MDIEICGSELRASNTIVSSSEGRKNITKIEYGLREGLKIIIILKRLMRSDRN